MADTYLNLCRALGHGDVKHDILEQYRQKLVEKFDPNAVELLLDEASAIFGSGADINQQIRERIFGSAELGPIAQQLTLMIFSGALWEKSKDGKSWVGNVVSADAYFSARLWPAISAHVPALSGGYSGHWRYGAES